ncbi:MAG: hypothetical protein ACRC5A_08895 [Enterobacteriaceae bacterium]
MSWIRGLGAFASGLNEGLSAGQNLGNAINRGRLLGAQREVNTLAQQQRDAEVEKKLGSPVTDEKGLAAWQTGSQLTSGREEARQYYQDNTDLNYLAAMKKVEADLSPQLVPAFRQWAQGEAARQGTLGFMQAVRLGQMGDNDGFARALEKMGRGDITLTTSRILKYSHKRMTTANLPDL